MESEWCRMIGSLHDEDLTYSFGRYSKAALLAGERLEMNFHRPRKEPRVEIFAGGKNTLLGDLIYIVGEILDGQLESQSWPVGVTQGVESQREILREVAGNPRAYGSGWRQAALVFCLYGSTTAILESHPRPQTASMMPVCEPGIHRVSLVHGRKEPPGFFQVMRLVDKSCSNGIPEINAPQPIVHISRQATTAIQWYFCPRFHSIGLASVEVCVGIDPRVRKKHCVNGVVALPVVTCERNSYSAGNLLARAKLELILTNRLEGRQRYGEILEKTGQPGARDENILNRRRNEKVIVRCVEHRTRTSKSV